MFLLIHSLTTAVLIISVAAQTIDTDLCISIEPICQCHPALYPSIISPFAESHSSISNKIKYLLSLTFDWIIFEAPFHLSSVVILS